MTPHERLAQISATLDAIRPGWPVLSVEIAKRIDDLTLQLIGQNDEQTRGRIKELRNLLDFPVSLQQERDGISAELSDQDSAN